ncbi:MAG: CHAT domain-containing protein, partial [Flavobacteriales bacterium]|nr:CHAT domain-containing protein [Flavobacteriales bacterium]
YLIHTSGGGAALIIQADQITPVWLDSVSTEALHAFLSEKIGSVSYFQAHQSLTSDAGITNGQTEWLEVLDKTCQWLWNNVLEKVIPTLEMSCSRGSKIMIVPCGLFSLLPIHAAWIADTRMLTGRRFAQDHFKFGYAPSAVLLLNRKNMVNAPHSESLLVVENPAGDLKYSSEAARTAMSFFDEALHLSGQSADRSTIKSNFHKYTTMYFFTHSAIHPERPFESGILLAANQWLTLKDIYSEAPIRNTRLVILAACETGLPADRSLLEQTVSLPSVLLRVGIPGIVGTLWPVPEASTAVLLTIFFELWRTMGYSPQAALAEAQRILRDARFVPADRNHFNLDQPAPRIKYLPAESVKLFNRLLKLGDFHHPYYWAGFIYYGF